jgi:hypothetical protein
MNASDDIRHLRPWTPGELADRAFYLLAHRPWMLLSCSLLFGLSEIVLGVWLLAMHRSPPRVREVYVLLWLVGNWGQAAGQLAAFQTLLFPLRPLKPKPLLKTALIRLPSFVLTRLTILIILMMFFWLVPNWSAGHYRTHGVLLCASLTFAAVAAGLFLFFRWSLSTMVVLVENRFLVGAMSRSNRLMKPASEQGRPSPARMGRWWLAAVLPAGVIALACIITCMAVGIAFHPVPFSTTGHITVSWVAIREISQGVACFLAAPIYWSGIALLYSQCRMRREAMDVMIRLQQQDTPTV